MAEVKTEEDIIINKKSQPIVHQAVKVIDNVQANFKRSNEITGKFYNNTKKGARNAIKVVGNAVIGVGHGASKVKDGSINGIVKVRKGFNNANTNFTGLRPKYEVINPQPGQQTERQFDFNSTVSLDDNGYIKIAINNEHINFKKKFDKIFKRFSPKPQKSNKTEFLKYDGFEENKGGSYKRKTYRGRKKISYLKKGRRSRRKRL